MLFKNYGINSGLPAFNATLCTSEEVSLCIHIMFLTLNPHAKDPDLLILRRLKWPKTEPWGNIIPKSPALPPILSRHRDLNEQSTVNRGQREGGCRRVQPLSFPLSCPHCGIVKECSSSRLYTTRIRCTRCSHCKRTTVASKWKCTCLMPWLQCQVHRPLGFSCNKASRDHKQFLQQKLAKNRLGVLGENGVCGSVQNCSKPLRNCSRHNAPNSAMKKTSEKWHGSQLFGRS